MLHVGVAKRVENRYDILRTDPAHLERSEQDASTEHYFRVKDYVDDSNVW